MNIKKIIIVISCLFMAACAVKKPAIDGPKQLSNIEKFAQDTLFTTAHVGFILINEKSGKVEEELNANKYFVPASNTKLFTAYATLKYLKDSLPGFFIRETADTLYFKPNADPTFLHSGFKSQKLFDKLRSTKKVLVVEKANDARLGVYGSGWSWANFQIASYPERTVMPIYENLVRFKVNATGGVDVSPTYFKDSITINGDIVGKRINVAKNMDKNTFVVKPANVNSTTRAFTTKGNADLPYMLLQDTLKSLKKELIIIDQQKRDRTFWKPFYTQKTADVVRIMMHNSDNFLAEQLLAMVGTALNSYPNDQFAISRVKADNFKEMSNPFYWADGSGLSRSNQITPRAITDLLVQMKKELGWQKVVDVLQKGNQGTVKGLYQGYENNIYTKTGTLGNNVVSLSGYLITKKGNKHVFALIVNNHFKPATPTRKAFEKFLINIIENY
ncbi:D-alanyl-D-alanine carboxypeptidase [Pedobacter sp. UBA4863]|uniref:D-alanyl-D-alanine carboxypeptidase n=2 Tax=Pedobacter TaxID=84567 RepID=UPI0025FFC4BA|nr:D-alanyl-D-alanine carboxypeptidase [Pedobacter sp. UBA4863]